MKTLATALLLSLNVLGASADEIGTETVNFLTTNSGWSKTPTTSTDDLSQYTYTSSCSTISFTSNAKIGTNTNFFIKEKSAFATSNGIEIANCTEKGVITIKCKEGYSIRKLSMEYGIPNKNGKATIFNLCGKNDDGSIETTVIAYPGTDATIKKPITISLESSEDYFTTVTLNKTGAPFMEINSLEIEYVNTTTKKVLLDELCTSCTSSTSSSSVQLGRTFSSSYWNTFCVPFDATAEQISTALGADCKIKSFGSANENGVITLADATTITAGIPYLMKPAADVTNPVFNGVTISSTTQPTAQDCGNGVSVQGIYVKTAKSDMNGTVSYLTTDNTIKTLSDDGSLKGMRAYFVTSDSNAKLSLDLGNGEVTAIDAIDNEPTTDSNAPAYNLAGQRVSKAYKGIVIVNGKKIVRK